jgi:hypothetical protein
MKAKFILIIAFTLLGIIAKAQIITTVAGGGNCGGYYCGDGGQATNAEFQGPFGVAVDVNGNIFISDGNNQVIRKVNTAGIITTAVGTGAMGFSGDGGQATNATLTEPYNLAIDIAGNLYIVDVVGLIRKVNTAGVITTVAGNATQGYSGDGAAATAAQLNQPTGVCVDVAGNIFIADQFNNVIRKVNTAGIITTVAGNGTLGFSGDGGAATNAKLNQPAGVCVDANGNIFTAEYNGNHIRKINTQGIITTIAGTGVAGGAGNGGEATSAQLYMPQAVATDTHGNVYVGSGCVVQKIDTAGIINLICGTWLNGYSGDGGVATTAQLSSPAQLTFDASGNLYIADYGNYRIRMITNVANMTDIESVTLKNSEVKIYPNPAQNNFTIETNSTEKQTLQLLDVIGKQVLLQTISGTANIDVSRLTKGVYFYSVIQNQQNVQNGKLIVE